MAQSASDLVSSGISIGFVESLEGEVLAKSTDDVLRVLNEGSAIYMDDEIITEEGSSVIINQGGSTLSFGSGESQVLSDTYLAQQNYEQAGDGLDDAEEISVEDVEGYSPNYVVGFVQELTGRAIAVAEDGTERVLRIGNAIHFGEKILTELGTEIKISFSDAPDLLLGENSHALIDGSLLDYPEPDALVEQTASIESLQAALAAGEIDITELEATAAGGTGEDAGNDFVRVDLEILEATPESGFETDPIANPFPPLAEEDLLPNNPPDAQDDFANPPLSGGGIGATNDALVTDEDEPLVIIPETLLSNDNDPDGDVLTIISVSNATNGSVVLNGDGTITFTPAPSFNGPATFVYTVTDGTLTDSATVFIDVLSVNGDTIAHPDTNFLAESMDFMEESEQVPASTSGNVLQDNNHGNGFMDQADTDSEDEPLFVSAVAGSGVNVGSLVDGDFGVLQLNADGSYLYVVDEFNEAVNSLADGDSINDPFTYTAADGNGGVSQTTLTITIFGSNDSPIAVEDFDTAKAGMIAYGSGDDFVPAMLTDANIATGNVLTNDADPDNGDSLSVSSISGDESGSVDGLYGTLTWNSNGTYTYDIDENSDWGEGTIANLANDEQGPTEVFTYIVTDGEKIDTQTLSITIFGANDGPTATPNDYDTKEDMSVGGNVLTDNTGSGTDSDPDGDSLTVQSNTDPSNGTVVVNANGTFLYTPDDDFNGQDSFTYTVTDGSKTDTATITINVDSVPDVGQQAQAQVDEDLLPGVVEGGVGDIDSGAGTVTDVFNGTILFDSTDIVSIDFSTVDADPASFTSGGETVTYTWDDGSKTLTATTDITDTKVFTLQVTNAATGAYTLTLLAAVDHVTVNTEDDITFDLGFTVTDSNGDSDTGTLPVLIDDDSPFANRITDGVIANEAITLNGVLDVDFGGDGGFFDLSSNIGNEPAGLTYSVINNPDGSSELTAKFFDADNVEQTFFILTTKVDGTYSFEIVNAQPTTSVTQSLASLISGNVEEFSYFLGDSTIKATFTGIDGVVGSTVNTSNQGMGVSANSLNDDDTLVMNIAQDGSPFVMTDAGFTLDKFTSGELLGWAVYAANDDLIASGTFDSTEGTNSIDVSFMLSDSDITFGDLSDGFTRIELTADNGSTDYRVADITVESELFPDDLVLDLALGGEDNDGDLLNESLMITIDGDGEPAPFNYILTGGSGDDAILGGSKGDILEGKAGDDILTGGGSADKFSISFLSDGAGNVVSSDGKDVIMDFNSGQGDILHFEDLVGFGDSIDSIAELDSSATVADVSGHTTITFDDTGDTVTLMGLSGFVSVASLDVAINIELG